MAWLVAKQLKPDGVNCNALKHTIEMAFATQVFIVLIVLIRNSELKNV